MSGSERLVGVDLARLVAVAGMMAAHTLAFTDPPVGAGVTALIDGPPSTLFAVLGGVSVALAARSRLAAGERAAAVRSTLARGLLVAVLGLLIVPIATAVFVVLAPFGVAIMAASVFLLLPTWVVAASALALTALVGSLVATARDRLGVLDGTHSIATLVVDPLGTLQDIVLTGVYPAITWLAYLLIGMLVARALTAARARGRERGALVGLAGFGAVLVALGVGASELGLRLLGDARHPGEPALAREVLLGNGYGSVPSVDPLWQLLAAPHTGTPADIARTVGIALLVIALLSLIVSLLPSRVRRAVEPLRAAGGAPLTIYVVHITLLSGLQSLAAGSASWLADGWIAWALQVAIALGIGALLAGTAARGPLEALIGRCADAAAGLRGTARGTAMGSAEQLDGRG
ncbi:heparan-alpha-glucosaminide N-acetyltransferase domain-containing protein [Agrococcus citreus]|uniref:heparan-alpha-glucosaminide N-acetyltransferase domain-containing protein n=1 Tax=Agrococcus citreus TaxID=84643 RepID=UPI0031D411A3